jgi:hypothetical protein
MLTLVNLVAIAIHSLLTMPAHIQNNRIAVVGSTGLKHGVQKLELNPSRVRNVQKRAQKVYLHGKIRIMGRHQAIAILYTQLEFTKDASK